MSEESDPMTFWTRVAILIFFMTAAFMLFGYLFPFPRKKDED